MVWAESPRSTSCPIAQVGRPSEKNRVPGVPTRSPPVLSALKNAIDASVWTPIDTCFKLSLSVSATENVQMQPGVIQIS